MHLYYRLNVYVAYDILLHQVIGEIAVGIAKLLHSADCKDCRARNDSRCRFRMKHIDSKTFNIELNSV